MGNQPARNPKGPARATLWTIGYEDRNPDETIATLQAAGIRQVVDVRELPLSRKPGFSKSAMAAALESASIAYRSERRLGAPREARHRLRENGSWPPFATAYQAHLNGQHAALEELARTASLQPTALLCFEKDAAACHRGLLAGRMAKRFDVVHL